MARATGGQQKRKKGQAGAAKNYITRTQAIKKLQCSISDFRRLCILKGIFPRQPRNHKKANKGSTAPASFYYVKDIAYLLHEPVLNKLREHKAFAKKLSKAVGRGEWSTAKSLEENKKPKYRLDHIIKERYPSFPDALRDLDDALSLIILFANLPASERIPASIISNCAKLAAEWQLYVLRTRSLRKVFLSIKGIYFQASVKGETVTWLVPYMFTQNIPSDIDFRIMMTFLELYQTLLGFTFYKLYGDLNLVYPPKLDAAADDAAGGLGSLLLEETSKTLTIEGKRETQDGLSGAASEVKKVTAKDVKKQIRSLTHQANGDSTTDAAMQAEGEAGTSSLVADPDSAVAAGAREFPKPLEGGDDAAALLASAEEENSTSLFEGYCFYLSREVTRPTLEFVIRSFGGQVGWDAVLGAGSAYAIDDPRITHHVIDRPVPAVNGNGKGKTTDSTALTLAKLPGKRAYVQPQWVVDCINARKLLPTEVYAPGKILPPHLSPFVDAGKVKEQGGYIPAEAGGEIAMAEAGGEGEEEESGEDEEEDEPVADEEEFAGFGEDAAEQEDEAADSTLDTEHAEGANAVTKTEPGPALLAAATNPDDASLLHAAELEAEARGQPYSEFQNALNALTKSLHKAQQKGSKKGADPTSLSAAATQEANPASMLLSNKQRKLFNKMKYGENRRKEEASRLEEKKKSLLKEEKKKNRK